MATQSYLSNLQQPYLPYMATQSYLSNPPAALFTIHGYSILPEQSPSSPIYHTWPLNPTWAITQQPYLPFMATQSYLSNHPVTLFTTHGYSILPEQSPSSPIYHTCLLNPTWAITRHSPTNSTYYVWPCIKQQIFALCIWWKLHLARPV